MKADRNIAGEDAVKRILVDTLFGLWATVNTLSRLRPSKRERYRVTIFGSARKDPDHWVYQEVKRMSRELAAMGCDKAYLARHGIVLGPDQSSKTKASLEFFSALLKEERLAG